MAVETAASIVPAAPSPPARRLRLAVVVQRYGTEINGGAELQARQITERLALHHDVTVLTSRALDYTVWDLHYPLGEQAVGGVPVLRFDHPPRNDLGRARVPKPHKIRFSLRRPLGWLPGGAVARPRGEPRYDGLDYLRRQGPHCGGLLQHLREHRARYDAAVFFTALYEPAAVGLPSWGPASILVPELHEEKAMFLPHQRRVFDGAGRIFYNTEAERRLAMRLYGRSAGRGQVVGLGIEMPQPAPGAAAEARARLKLPPRYLVYVGRVDTAKGCGELMQAFEQAAARDSALALVLVGQVFMRITAHPRLVSTGFVSDADRNAIVAGAQALVLPSRYESLSMVLLEAMALRVPVLANRDCEVLADHIRLSGGGWVYRGAGALTRALLHAHTAGDAERRQLGDGGEAYVRERYTWPRVMAQYQRAFDELTASTASSQPASTRPAP